MLVPARDVAPLAHHSIAVEGRHLGGHGALYELADLHNAVAEAALFLRHERGVGGHAVDQPGGHAGANLVEVCGVEEYLHCGPILTGAQCDKGEGLKGEGCVSAFPLPSTLTLQPFTLCNMY